MFYKHLLLPFLLRVIVTSLEKNRTFEKAAYLCSSILQSVSKPSKKQESPLWNTSLWLHVKFH